jgi:hypothetical protein
MNVAGFTSETGMLIEGALAQVRATARLDDDPVLPPLPVVAPRTKVIVLKKADVPWPSVSVKTPPTPTPTVSASQMPTVNVRDVKKPGVRWPIVACAFVACVFAGAAFMSSPAGARPGVRNVVNVSKAKSVGAYHAVATVVTSVVHR